MIGVKKHFSPFSVKKWWLSLEKNGQLSGGVEQLYYLQEAFYYRRYFYGVRGKKYIYFEIRDDNETVMVLPLREIGINKYTIIGDVNGLEVYDCIYNRNMTIDAMKKYLRNFVDIIKAECIHFSRVKSDSLVLAAARQMGCANNEGTRDYVNIHFESDYESYYSELSKNMRQNIRTAYNRMNTDAMEFSHSLLLGESISTKRMNETLDLYNDRHETRYGLSVSWLKELYLKTIDWSTHSMKCWNRNANGFLYINGELAAFFSGYAYGNSIVVPRLSVNKNYSRYSPGIVLITETIKKLLTDGRYQNFDLSVGTEKYKLDLGGKTYYTYHFDFI